jgi:hypothetical protein
MSDEGARWIGAATYAKKDEVRRRAVTHQSVSACRRPSCCSKRLCPDQGGERAMLQFVTYTQDLGYWQENHVFVRRCSRVGIPFIRLVFCTEEFLRVGSFARLPCTRTPSEELFREALPRSFRPFRLVSVSQEKGARVDSCPSPTVAAIRTGTRSMCASK